jgi:shikimate kinase
MPGAGKSTVGIILAKNLSFGFIDTDILIQINHQKSLQQIMDENDHLHLRAIEEQEILKLNITRHVIATGGSAPYSEKSMALLQKISHIVFLRVGIDELKRRIHNYETRGIAKAPTQTFMELFEERRRLYEMYAEITVPCDAMNQDQIAETIARKVTSRLE